VGQMLAVRPIRSVLVVAPHADDEAVGAGGLIAKLTNSDVSVRVLFMAVDGFHHYGIERNTTLAERKQEIEKASATLGFEYRIVYEGRDLMEKLDTVPQRDLVDLYESELNEHRPDMVLLPHGMDFDQDHVACFRAALAATRPIPEGLGKHFPAKVLTYEMPKLVWSEQPFRPTVYWDITREIDVKLRAVASYTSQLRKPPHIRSPENIRCLARLRGSEIGVEFAEAYHALRWVV